MSIIELQAGKFLTDEIEDLTFDDSGPTRVGQDRQIRWERLKVMRSILKSEKMKVGPTFSAFKEFVDVRLIDFKYKHARMNILVPEIFEATINAIEYSCLK